MPVSVTICFVLIFRETSKHVTCVLFIDEIDVLCPSRGQGDNLENRVASQLLTLIDGMFDESNVILIAATNRPNSLDQAVRRPGRLDKEVCVYLSVCMQTDLIFLQEIIRFLYVPISN